jgi:pantetheine-phosphate adenylyltransferase
MSLTAVYPGTFDPLTRGHEDILRRAARLFPKVVLAVASAHHKKTLFNLQERLDMARIALADVPQVQVVAFEGLLSSFVRAQGAGVVVRGIRAVSDYDYEFQMAGMNRQLMPEVETVFLVPGEAYQFVSGTFVREIAMLGGDVSAFVSEGVLQRLHAKRAAGV